MTKSTITRERLLEIIVTGPEASGAEQNELARIALAAIDSEPVAYMYDGEDGREYNGHNEFSGGGKGIPLYRHAQPSPIVPDELLNEIDDLLSVCRVYACRSRRNGSENDIPRTEKAQNWLRACRAAMLAAAQQELKK